MKSKMGKMLFLTERPLQEKFNIYNSGAEDSKLAERCGWDVQYATNVYGSTNNIVVGL